MSEVTLYGLHECRHQTETRLVFQAHRLWYHSTLGVRVIKKKKKKKNKKNKNKNKTRGTAGVPHL